MKRKPSLLLSLFSAALLAVVVQFAVAKNQPTEPAPKLEAAQTDAPKHEASEPLRYIHNRENVHGAQDYEALRTKPQYHDTYNVAFSAYSKAFAEQFGAAPDGITDLDKGLAFMSISMVTEGTKPMCYYHLVLDSSVKLALPKEEYIAWIYPLLPLRVGGDPNESAETLKKDDALIMLALNRPHQTDTRFWNHVRVSSLDKSKAPNASDNLFLEQYHPNRQGYQMLVLRSSCIFGASVFEYHAQNPATIQLGHDAGHDYSRGGNTPEKFFPLRIPQRLIAQISPIIIAYKNKELSRITAESTLPQ